MRRLSAISGQLTAVRGQPAVNRSRKRKLKAEGRPLKARRCAAFTLIELLTVIAIIGILAGLILAASKYATTKGATSRARAELSAMETALENFKADNGYYPNTGTTRADVTNNSSVLYTTLAGGSKNYFHFKADQLRVLPGAITNVIDPFGSAYNYYQTNDPTLVTNAVTFDLWSYGPNGVNDEGANDDITNWKQN